MRLYTPPSAVWEIWKGKFDMALEERGLFLLTMPPHIIGHRSRQAMLVERIRYMRSHTGAWFATQEQIARFAKQHA